MSLTDGGMSVAGESISALIDQGEMLHHHMYSLQSKYYNDMLDITHRVEMLHQEMDSQQAGYFSGFGQADEWPNSGQRGNRSTFCLR